MNVLPACMCPIWVQILTRPEYGIRYSGTRITDGCEPLCGYWDPNPGPQKEQQVLLNFLRFVCFIYMNILPECMYACLVPSEVREHWKLEVKLGGCEAPCRCWELLSSSRRACALNYWAIYPAPHTASLTRNTDLTEDFYKIEIPLIL